MVTCIVGSCPEIPVDGKRCALHGARYRYGRTYKSKHAEDVRRRAREYDATHPEKKRLENRKQYLKDPAARVFATAQWREQNPGARKDERASRILKHGRFRIVLLQRISNANQRAAKLGREGRISESEVLRLYESQGGKCFDCGEKRALSIGHLVPLFHRFSTNDITNIVLQCHSCNSRQHNAIHPSAEESYWRRVREHLDHG